MTIRFGNYYDTDEFITSFPIFLGAIIVFCIVLLIVFTIVSYQIQHYDDQKPLITKRICILQKILSWGNTEWYLVEFENGERMKIRSFQAQTLLISVNDIGVVAYRGNTIQSFKREVRRRQSQF